METENCKNGFIHVVDRVIVPLDNMAEVIRKESNLSKADKKEINACLANLKGWRPASRPFHAGKEYGSQRGFVRSEGKYR